MATDEDGANRTTVISQDAVFYAMVDLKNAPDDTQLKAVWTVVDAAKTEPDIADLLNNMLDQRMRNLGAVAQHLPDLGSLREGLDEAQATETIWVITSPEVFSLLLGDRGWTKEQYVHWLNDTLIRLLLF